MLSILVIRVDALLRLAPKLLLALISGKGNGEPHRLTSYRPIRRHCLPAQYRQTDTEAETKTKAARRKAGI